MPLKDLEAAIRSVPFTKEEIGRIWEKKRGAFEVF